MTQFHFEAFDAKGQISKGLIEAESLPKALNMIKERDLNPFRTTIATGSEGNGFRFQLGQRVMSLQSRVRAIRQLATLLKAGITVDRALEILANQAKGHLDRSVIEKSQKDISAGQSLSATLRTSDWGFKPGEVGLVQASEKSGSLVASLEDLADYLEKQQEMRSKLTSALVYPAFLLALIPISLSVIALVLVPNIAPLFEETGAEMPFILQTMVMTTHFVSNNFELVSIGVILLLMLIILILSNPKNRVSAGGWIFRLPVLNRITKASDAIRLCRALGLLLRGGAPMQNALAVAVDIAPTEKQKLGLDKVRNAVAGGNKLADALKQQHLLDPASLQMIAIGEETNKLDTMLLYIANSENNRLSNFIERLMTLLTPILTILMGIMVGGIVMSVMRAILSINELATR